MIAQMISLHQHQVRLKLVTAQIIPQTTAVTVAQVAQVQVQIQGLQEAQVQGLQDQELVQVQDLAKDQGMGRKQRPPPLNQQDRTLM